MGLCAGLCHSGWQDPAVFLGLLFWEERDNRDAFLSAIFVTWSAGDSGISSFSSLQLEQRQLTNKSC